MQQSLGDFNWPNEPITTSIGIASIHSKIKGEVSKYIWEKVYRHADAALYFLKANGRNSYNH